MVLDTRDIQLHGKVRQEVITLVNELVFLYTRQHDGQIRIIVNTVSVVYVTWDL